MSDIPANSSTTASISVGGTYSGTINSNSDKDWVRIDLAPGQFVEVTQDGVSNLDSYLVVYDADGREITYGDAVSNSNLQDASVIFGGGTGGTYYVEAGSYNNGSSGDYTLTATNYEPPAGDPTDAVSSDVARGDTNITVYFVPDGATSNFLANTSGTDDVISEGWSANERSRVEAALATIAAVTNLTFTIDDTNPNADFQLIKDDDELFADSGQGLLGYFYLPGNGSYTGQSAGVFNGQGFGWEDGLGDGGLGFATMIHEFLHGLGLEHPHDSDTPLDGVTYDPTFGVNDLGLNGFNQEVFTIMSYNRGLVGTTAVPFETAGSAMTPMPLDIAMLHEMYGASANETGDNTYDLATLNGWRAIWDTDGTDEITYGGASDVVIDLRPATLTYGEGGAGFVSQIGNASGGFVIANGVTIENASGGSGDDLLIGNDADNGLTGNGGNDVLLGGDGADDLDGGGGNDTLLGEDGDDDLSGGSGNDTASGGIGDDTVSGGADNDTLMGDSGADTITDSSGTNTIYGGSGYDILTGGTGQDTIYGGSGNDTITGNGGADILSGGRGNDTIDGGAGADTITGGMGADTMTGGADADTFVFNSVVDSTAANADTITDFAAGSDTIDLSAVSSGTFGLVGSFSGTTDEIVLNEAGGNTTVQVDVNGDGIADMAIFIAGEVGLEAGDFIL